ncbi:hypothetical protein B0O80DRAFT_467078 [Mortierella sp. GBAus27b]|nr:hypothetical protein B0O80DRAFT_475529 [Mortierella sp. GBAus27b]KAI8346734.1 hypothetical protein B0O80DRAFT_467078 [Mortierella sp. GBAus27b]
MDWCRIRLDHGRARLLCSSLGPLDALLGKAFLVNIPLPFHLLSVGLVHGFDRQLRSLLIHRFCRELVHGFNRQLGLLLVHRF